MRRQTIPTIRAVCDRSDRRAKRVALWSAFFVCILLLPFGDQEPLYKQMSLQLTGPLESFIPEPEALDLSLLDTETIQDVSLSDSNLWTRITIKTGDSLSKIFSRLGLSSDQLDEILSLSEDTTQLSKLFPGQTLHFLIQDDELRALAQPIDPAHVLYVVQNDGTFQSVLHTKEVESRLAFGGGTIERSLIGAGKEVGLDTKVLMQLVNIFGYDIDFANDIQPNDTFRLLYEEHYVDGQRMSTGHILAAEFVNDGRVYRAVRYEDAEGRVNYFTPTGEGMHKAFLRTPVNFTRISSHFNLHRKHPILHKIRAHKGVDYAAPVGTPVRAAGDGYVQFVGSKGGYGKTIMLQHGKHYSTLYGHLSRFSSTVKRGQHVQQGQIIGYVGMTGLASGPHLHYEFRVDGVHRNPLTVDLPMSETIASKELHKFKVKANQLLAMMERQEASKVSD